MPLTNHEVSHKTTAFATLKIDGRDTELKLSRTFLTDDAESCVFSVKTAHGHGVLDVCTETGHVIEKNWRIDIVRGKVAAVARPIILEKKKVMKVFLLNENKRVKKFGKELWDMTMQVFLVAKRFIEVEDFGEYKIELALHGILDVETENLRDWNIYKSLKRDSRSNEGFDLKYQESHDETVTNIRNIDDDINYPHKNPSKNSTDDRILDNETEEKLRNIGVVPSKSGLLDIKNLLSGRGSIGAYKLISRYSTEFDRGLKQVTAERSSEYDSPESLERFADMFEPIKNDPRNEGSLFQTSNLIVLLTDKEDSTNIEGLTFIGGACSANDSYSVIRLKSSDSTFYHGKVMAHEILHSLNAKHDKDEKDMLMEQQGCTTCMEDDRRISENTKKQIRDFIASQDSTCFDKFNLCGNGMIDEGEECDPGSPFGSECCTPTCKLKSNAQCDDLNGKCCKNCKFLPKDSQCGSVDTMNECELPSICSGKSATCLKSYKTDGTQCRGGICKKGVCQNRQLMCERINRRFDESCKMVDSCQLVCVDNENHCSLMGSILKDFQTPLALPNGLPCRLDGVKGTCSNGSCEVIETGEKYMLVVAAIGLVLIVVLVIMLGFLP